MKQKAFTILAMVVFLCMTACESKLDIVPKGMTTLNTVDDLETLLNQDPQITTSNNEYEILCNNMYDYWEGLPEYLANPNSLIYALVTYDENVDRASLTTSSYVYEYLYRSINYMNVIISKAPEAAGDDAKRRQIIAEAHILRAWYHFILVNTFAKQYDEATASELGGIPYVDNTDVSEEKQNVPLRKYTNGYWKIVVTRFWRVLFKAMWIPLAASDLISAMGCVPVCFSK